MVHVPRNVELETMKHLLKKIKSDNPTDIYFSTSAWLNPIDLPRKNDSEKLACDVGSSSIDIDVNL